MFVIIVGGGKVGMHLAALLLEAGHQVRVIEADRSQLDALEKELGKERLMIGNGADPAVLEGAGIRTANVVAAVTGADEINLVVTSLARFEFQVPRTIGRVNDPKNAWMFTKTMGVDVPVNQANVMVHLILEEMSLGDMLTLLKLRRGQFSLVEEKVDPRALAVGKRVSELHLPDDCRLVAVIRDGQLLMPTGELVLQPVDEVLALVHNSQLKLLAGVLGVG